MTEDDPGYAQLVRDLRAPVAPPIAQLVAGVMARLDERRPVRRWQWPVLALAGGAAALALWLAVPRREAFVSRGGGGDELPRTVGIELYVLDRELRPLGAGSRVTVDTAYVVSYRHAGAAPAYALIFALDRAGELHWLFPAYTDAATDALSLELAPATGPTLLADAVVLDAPAPGPLVVVSIVSPAPLHVSDIERMPHALQALRLRWPALQALEVDVDQPR